MGDQEGKNEFSMSLDDRILEQMKKGEIIDVPLRAIRSPLENFADYSERYLGFARQNGIKEVRFLVGRDIITVTLAS
jgi:hypothetical protein